MILNCSKRICAVILKQATLLVYFVFLVLAFSAGETSAATLSVEITSESGRFTSASGGASAVFGGISTSSVSTGEPFSGSDQPNRLTFNPKLNTNSYDVIGNAPDIFDLNIFDVEFGTFVATNGTTKSGTSGSAFLLEFAALVTYELEGECILFSETDGCVEHKTSISGTRPLLGIANVGLHITPNTSGNAITDADYWCFDTIGCAPIPENHHATFKAFGTLFPQNTASPPEYYEFGLSRIEDLQGNILGPIPVPLPQPDFLLFVLIVSVVAWSSSIGSLDSNVKRNTDPFMKT